MKCEENEVPYVGMWCPEIEMKIDFNIAFP